MTPKQTHCTHRADHSVGGVAEAGSGCVDGIGAPTGHRIGALLSVSFACLLLGLLFISGASAAETRQLQESFGPDGTSASSFDYPISLAFDQSNRRLYVLNQETGLGGTAAIYGFDASAPASFTPLSDAFPIPAPGAVQGFLDDLAVDSSTHRIYRLSEGEESLFGYEGSGAPLAGFPITNFSDGCGAATDPAGNLWVGDYSAEAVVEFDPAGTRIASIDTSAQGPPCRVALDSEDNLYVSFYEGATWRYSASSNYTAATEIDPLPSSALAVDRASGQLFVAHSDHVSVYSPAGTLKYEFGKDVTGAAFSGIAIDEANDRVFVTDVAASLVRVFGAPVQLPEPVTQDATAVTVAGATLNGSLNSNGEQLTECYFEFGTTTAYGQSVPCVPGAAALPPDFAVHAVSADIAGLSAGTTYHFRLVGGTVSGSAPGNDRTLITASGPPTVDSEFASSVGDSDATVTASIDPRGALTTYHVEYGTTSAYGQSTSASAAIGFPGDLSSHLVSLHLTGLAPGQSYHFRFVADNAAGETLGSDASFSTYPSSPAFGPCPNDAFRTGPGVRLPDCRAYEQVTPENKNGASAQFGTNFIKASSTGDRLTFYLNGGLPAPGGRSTLSAYLASRVPGGWSSASLLPETDPGSEASVLGWNESLSSSASLTPLGGAGGYRLYLRDSATGSFAPAAASQERGLLESGLAAFASDPSHLLFETEANLLPGLSGAAPKAYDLDDGILTLVGRIPPPGAKSCDDAGAPICTPAPQGSFAGSYAWFGTGSTDFGGPADSYYSEDALSRDGARAFFTARGTGQLYFREDAVRTTDISASQAAVPDPEGEKPAAFLAASPDGSTALFLSCQKLTDDSTASATSAATCSSEEQGQDLYSYSALTRQLTDLTVDSRSTDPLGAAVQGVLGTSQDASTVYFVANGVLAENEGAGGSHASPGNCAIDGGGGKGEVCNLYVESDGVVTYIATLSGNNNGDRSDWMPLEGSRLRLQKHSRVSADGQTLLFASESNLTGYDNRAPQCIIGLGQASGPCTEFFRYSAATGALSCVSCNPTGSPPAGEAGLGSEAPVFGKRPAYPFITRNLSADGSRVFFESPDPLVAADTNGVNDAYEWEASGSGSCHSVVQNGGCLYLLSGGTAPDPSYYLDSSSSGDHVFISTYQQLVPSDQDGLADAYDVGIGAGLATQHQGESLACSGTACQGAQLPAQSEPSASTNSAATGAATRCRPGFARKKGRCVRRRVQHHHHRKRHIHHTHRHQHASAKSGGSK